MCCIASVWVGGFYFCLPCFSFSPSVPIYSSFGEAPLSPELASRKTWILRSLEKGVLAVIHRKTEQVYRAPADCLGSSLVSCIAVRQLMLLGTDTEQQIFRDVYSSLPVRQFIKFEECLTLKTGWFIILPILTSWNKKSLKLLLLSLLILSDWRHGVEAEGSHRRFVTPGLALLSSYPELPLGGLVCGWTYLVRLE